MNPKNAIAIIGMSGRFPKARNLHELWENLKNGSSGISFFSDSELAGAEFDFEAVRSSPNFVKARGVLDDVELFDAGFFGFKPREAQALDPQQRLWFECAWEALEDACVEPTNFDGAIGVFGGGGYLNTYLLHNLCKDREYIERLVRLRSVDAFQAIISNDKDFLPTRTSYLFNLKGPSVNVQTACSTSLVAVVMAIKSLRSFESDVCLAGGVSIQLPQVRGYVSQEGGMDSADGVARVFDAKASGTVFSNGIGVVVLKRLEDALADRDPIRAVILGSAMNNDGSSKPSYIAPNPDGQAEVIALAQADAGVEPRSISYLEAHGTATQLGDPIEIRALTQAFRLQTGDRQFCRIGSIKSNIGHLDSAAGVAGLIKTVLALQHRQIPPSIHFEQPNPEIDFDNSPFRVVSQLEDWNTDRLPRRAGVSSFGVGGTNAHVILEEAPPPPISRTSKPYSLLLLSARTGSALELRAKSLAEYLQKLPDVALPDVAYSLQIGRKDMAHRRFAVCADRAGAIRALEDAGGLKCYSNVPDGLERSVVFMFTGQGSQYAGMSQGLYESEPAFRETIDHCCELLKPTLGIDLRTLLYPAGDAELNRIEGKLQETAVAQPALFVVEYALAKLWMSWGIRPAAMIGHSVGEYVAATLSGVFALKDALVLVAERGRLMQLRPTGAMLAVRQNEVHVRELLGGNVEIAAINSPQLTVVSGPKEEVDAFARQLEEKGIGCVRLHTSHAFHSAMMEQALSPFAAYVERLPRNKPQVPFISCVSGNWVTDEQAMDSNYWAQQIRRPVQFSKGVKTVLANPKQVFLEVGPGRTLCNLSAQHGSREYSVLAVPSLGGPKDEQLDTCSIIEAMGRLWLAGITPDWRAFHQHENRNRLALPTYPFERQRYWIEPPRFSPDGSHAPAGVSETAEAVPVVSAPECALVETGSRRDRIFLKLKEVLSELSGFDFTDADSGRTFLEMGMDSLFLTQVSTELRNTLGVKVKFRQLLEEVDSLDALTDYCDAQLPGHAFAAPVATATATPVASAGASNASGGDAIAQMQRQLQLIAQQLQALSSGVAQPSTAPVSPPSPAGVSADEEAKFKKPFGAAARIDITRRSDLSPAQRRRLEEFTVAYCTRTARSKAYTQLHRDYLADPRVVTGFTIPLKELVYPLVVDRSRGSKLWDIDGNEYVDMLNGFGSCLFGHEPEFIISAVEKQLRRSIEVGPQHDLSGEVSALFKEITGLERNTFCNTGSEATMGALRIARTVTGKSQVVIFTNSYHGIYDEVLVRGTKKLKSIPASPGVPPQKVHNMLVLDYCSRESLDIIRSRARDLAAVMVEPVQSRDLDMQPREFLHELRKICSESGVAFIMDEVINGFRTCPGGAQEYFGVRADLATYGKIIGGGIPIGVIAGIPRFMDALDGGMWQFGDDSFPSVGVTYFAGTFVRHPLALAACKAVLLELKRRGPDLQRTLTARTTEMVNELRDFFRKVGAPIHLPHFSSCHQVRFTEDVPYASLFWPWIRSKGVHMLEGCTWFLTDAHSDADRRLVVDAFKQTVQELQEAEFLPSRRTTAGASLPVDLEAMPLSEAQREIWFAAQLGPAASCCYNESFNLHLRGPLELEKLRAAIQEIYARHEAHQLRFSPAGEWQHLAKLQPLAIPFLDLSDLDESARSVRLDAAVEQDATTPFDLVNGPLVRAQIVKLDRGHHVLLSTAHHIVMDGWSAGVFIEEVGKVYSAALAGRAAELPPAPSYLKYVRDETNRQSTEEGRAALKYWTDLLAGPPRMLELPADRPRPKKKSFRGGTVHWQSTSALYRNLKQAASRQGVTLYAALLAGYRILIHRLSGQTDFVVGIPTAGQSVVGEEGLIGHCVNLLPLRSRLAPAQTVAAQVMRTKRELLDAQDHQECTFGAILRALSLERQPGRSPLVEVVFNLNRDLPGEAFLGLEARIQENRKRFVNWDMFFNLDETDEFLTMDLDYNADIFDEATIRLWLGHFEEVLRVVAEQPECAIGDVSLLNPEQRRTLLVDWNQTQSRYPAGQTLVELFVEQARRSPDATAVVCGSERLSYRQLEAHADQFARCLSEAGAQRGQLVGVYLERSVSMLVAVLGVMKAGAAYVPLDPSFPAKRLRWMIEDAAMPVIVTQSSLASALPPHHAQLVCLDRPLSETPNPQPPTPNSKPEDPAYVIYTSGSTGRPKGVQIPHRALVNFLTSMQREPGMSANDILVAVTTLSFDIAGLELFLPLICGATTVIASREETLDGHRLAALLESSKATVMQATPATWRLLLDAGWTGSPSLKILCGGEALSHSLKDQLCACCGELWNMYGPTETTIWSTTGRLSRAEPVTIGRPIANTTIYLLDDSLKPVPVGVLGTLYIGGDGLASGYFGKPDLTRERFIPHPFAADTSQRIYNTGDLARYLPDGRIVCLGRCDTQVKVRGFRIELDEIESALARFPGVRAAVVAVHPDQTGENRLVAYYIPEGRADLTMSAFRIFLSKSLPEYMVPSIFLPLEALPLTPNGKVDRRALPPPEYGRLQDSKKHQPPSTPLQREIADIWSAVLEVSNPGVDDDFFDLGGHSVLAMRAVTRLREKFQVNIPLGDFFENTTIATLAAYVENVRLVRPREGALEGSSEDHEQVEI